MDGKRKKISRYIHVCVNSFSMFQKIKRKVNKEWKEKSTVETKDRNIEKWLFEEWFLYY